MIEIPQSLRQVEFTKVFLQLEFQDSYELLSASLLRLRRDLLQVAKMVLGDGGDDKGRVAGRYRTLFDPPLPQDPVALRRYQRPGPPFAISAGPELAMEYEIGDTMELPVLFLGRGITRIGDFIEVLAALGGSGFHRGEGPFEVLTAEAVDPSGKRLQIWDAGDDTGSLAPPICDAFWWLETTAQPQTDISVNFVNPARLISQHRPLFRASFGEIFPFVLRRVSSMVYSHCGLEIIEDPQRLLWLAKQLETVTNELYWADWRTLDGPRVSQDLGGLLGGIKVSGTEIAQIFWIVKFASLLNLGRGAAYGAGKFVVD